MPDKRKMNIDESKTYRVTIDSSRAPSRWTCSRRWPPKR